MVGLLDLSEVVCGMLHAREQVLGDLVPQAACVRLRGECVRGGIRGLEPCGQYGGRIEVKGDRQHVEQGEGRKTMAALEAAHVLWGDVLPQELGAALCQGLLREALGLACVPQAQPQRWERGPHCLAHVVQIGWHVRHRRWRCSVDRTQTCTQALQGWSITEERYRVLDVCHTHITHKGAQGLRLERWDTEWHHERVRGAPVPRFVVGNPHREAVHRVLGDMFNDPKDAAIGVQPTHDVVPRRVEAPMAQHRVLTGDLGIIEHMNGRYMVSHYGVRPDIAIEPIHGWGHIHDLAVDDTCQHFDPFGNPCRTFEIAEETLDDGIMLHILCLVRWAPRHGCARLDETMAGTPTQSPPLAGLLWRLAERLELPRWYRQALDRGRAMTCAARTSHTP